MSGLRKEQIEKKYNIILIKKKTGTMKNNKFWEAYTKDGELIVIGVSLREIVAKIDKYIKSGVLEL